MGRLSAQLCIPCPLYHHSPEQSFLARYLQGFTSKFQLCENRLRRFGCILRRLVILNKFASETPHRAEASPIHPAVHLNTQSQPSTAKFRRLHTKQGEAPARDGREGL
ncbi:hypothetical protein E2C01_024548 [Portunus trituberculatus]|uniref:Uncharacterized protein n=1 Tax=Portunus trituberculatus TaxID=210409 RepID=A0A5B7EE34_PORTR|nr:hypothetical protein [Portunus trituberculatus]